MSVSWIKPLSIGLAALLALLAALLAATLYFFIAMPGNNPRPDAPAPAGAALDALAQRLRGHVRVLSEDIGPRNYTDMAALNRAADYIRDQFRAMAYEPEDHHFGAQGFRNLSVEIPGRAGGEWAGEILVVGAHYDTSLSGTPGADDNASGVAALLELARALAGAPLPRTVRLVAFPNEEEPYFGTELMGSRVSARRAAETGDQVVGMLSLEMLGYYSSAPGSQFYPPVIRRFYPDQGNFIAFVSNVGSRGFRRRAVAGFRRQGIFPAEGMAAPVWLVDDIRRSDNSSFWDFGFPAVMVTDTSNFRNPYYHTRDDVMATLDFAALARVAHGLDGMVRELSGAE